MPGSKEKTKTDEALPQARESGGQRVRPELNLEKWPLWHPSKSKTHLTSKVCTRQVRLANGDLATASVEVVITKFGPLTTEDQKTYYALVKIWEDRGRPENFTPFTLRQLATVLKKKGWGTNVITALTESLMRLRATLLIWENSYMDGTTRETVELIDTFNILSELKIVRRRRGEKVVADAAYFKFNDHVLKNLYARHTKPLLLDTVLGFDSEVAQILYTHLDLILSGKTQYERRTRELFDDLGLEGTAYRYPSKRAQVLEPALKELQGQPLTTGLLVSATLEKTVDQKDFKAVFRKGRLVSSESGKAEEAAQLAKPASAASPQMIAAPMLESPQTVNARKLVVEFHETFFKSGRTVHPSAREVDHAVSLIARLGMEAARYVIEFASRAARETKYSPQTFGGILQYEARAMLEYSEIRDRREKARQRQQAEALVRAQDLHREKFTGPYNAYLRQSEARIRQSDSEAYSAFLVESARLRKAVCKPPITAEGSIGKRLLALFDSEEEHFARLFEFFPDAGLLGFDEWDRKLNATPFRPEAESPEA